MKSLANTKLPVFANKVWTLRNIGDDENAQTKILILIY